MDLKESDLMNSAFAERHWYYASKARIVSDTLDKFAIKPSSILDIGAGSGFFSKHLLKHTDAQEAICFDINYPDDDRQEKTAGGTVYYRNHLDFADDVDTVLLMDVLEHVEDDVSLLTYWVEKTPENAVFLITVPAFKFLWSAHDIFLGHIRRYTLGGLEKTVTGSGLELMSAFYCFSSIFPLALASRIAGNIIKKNQKPESQLRQHGPIINNAMKILCGMEKPWMMHNRLFGLTVCCLANKKP